MVQLQMLQQLSGRAWQEITFKCKKLDIDGEYPPVFKSYAGDVESDYVEVLSNSCQVTIVTYHIA